MGATPSNPNTNFSLPGSMNFKLNSKLRKFEEMKLVFAKAVQPLKTYNQLYDLRKSINNNLYASMESSQIPLMELHNYLLGNLGQNLHQDKSSLKDKRSQLFEFVNQNVYSYEDFVVTKILKIINEAAQKMILSLKYQKLAMVKVFINSSLELFNLLLLWLYGEQIFHVFIDPKLDQDSKQYIVELYRSELVEYILFFQSQQIINHLLRLRNLEVQFLSIKIKNDLKPPPATLKKGRSLKEELLTEQRLGYDVIVRLLQRIAKTNFFTTKYKLLSILFDTIPQLYLQEQLKNQRSLHRVNSEGLQKHKVSVSQTFLLKKPFEVETMLSTMLSTDKKREISRVMLNEWLLFTKRDIIVDILVPFKLLQEDGYIQEPEHFLHAFLHGLYEIVEVDQNRNSGFF